MQGMISRYRDRLSSSSSEIKALSASREKSISNNNSNINISKENNNNDNSLQVQSILVMNSIPSTESLGKCGKQFGQQSRLQQGEDVGESNIMVANSLKQLSQHKYSLNSINTISNNPSCLPPQPNLNTHTKQKLKQSLVSTTTPHEHNLKSSKKTSNTGKQALITVTQTNTTNKKNKQKQFVMQKGVKKEKQPERQRQRSRSKGKTHTKAVSNKKTQPIHQLTSQQLTQSFSQSIYDIIVDVNVNELNYQKNNSVNKDEMKLKIGLLLEQYWEKRYEISQREREIRQEGDWQQLRRNNNQLRMAQSIVTNFNNTNNNNNNPHTEHGHTPQQFTSFTIQLQKRFFQTQKQRQFLQKKLQSLSKKFQSMNKQLQRYVRLEKLVNNTIESENEARREVVRLRKELEYSQLKNNQQQKIWRKETMEINQIIEELREQLRQKYKDGEV